MNPWFEGMQIRRSRKARASKDGRPVALVLIDLVQDAEVLSPIIDRLLHTQDLVLRVAVSDWLRSRAPRIPALLRGMGADFEYCRRAQLLEGRGPSLNHVDLVLTASDSTASPHRWVHALVVRAKARGCKTFTVQHGLDNLEMLKGPDRRDFASDVLFCWPSPDQLPPDLDPTVMERLICVGRTATAEPVVEPRFDLGIFENLHARHYGEDERQSVLACILGLAAQRPGLSILVRAHPAGGWLDHAAGRLKAMPNVVFMDSARSRRSTAPASAAVSAVARVITTPSTVALDAARCGRPVAITQGGDALFDPLPRLGDLGGWIRFADGPTVAGAAEAAFLSRHEMEGDAVGRIIAHLTARPLNAAELTVR